mmetsp:Transcript_1696/g.4003  ORF Transcript_1696/g.4003 Transcript_1696/m.4003 type:complete len:236 (-) Transcript_1696:561-1268(-)
MPGWFIVGGALWGGYQNWMGSPDFWPGGTLTETCPTPSIATRNISGVGGPGMMTWYCFGSGCRIAFMLRMRSASACRAAAACASRLWNSSHAAFASSGSSSSSPSMRSSDLWYPTIHLGSMSTMTRANKSSFGTATLAYSASCPPVRTSFFFSSSTFLSAITATAPAASPSVPSFTSEAFAARQCSGADPCSMESAGFPGVKWNSERSSSSVNCLPVSSLSTTRDASACFVTWRP